MNSCSSYKGKVVAKIINNLIKSRKVVHSHTLIGYGCYIKIEKLNYYSIVQSFIYKTNCLSQFTYALETATLLKGKLLKCKPG